jgi:hypothetical protein
MPDGLHIRPLNGTDAHPIAAAFSNIRWVKPAALFHRYLAEQEAGTRSCWVANLNDAFAGYVTVNWQPTYPEFAENKIPEILNQSGSPNRLRSDIVGKGVGLYNGAHRLYGKNEKEVTFLMTGASPPVIAICERASKWSLMTIFYCI